jgi:hypothetical protein
MDPKMTNAPPPAPDAQPAPTPGASPAPGGAPGKPAPGGKQMSDRAINVYQRLVAAAMKAIYGDQNGFNAIVNMLKQAQDPVSGIVQATMSVLDALHEKIKGIPPELAYKIAPEVALQIGAIAVKAGVAPDSMQQLAGPVLQALKAEIDKRGDASSQPTQAPGQQQPPAQPQQQPPQAAPQPAGLLQSQGG